MSAADLQGGRTEVPGVDSGVDLGVALGGLRLDNPIATASGCFASGREMDRFVDVGSIGAVVVKSLTRLPRKGLPTPRMVETPSGMLNAIGLQNPGIDAWLEDDLPWLVEHGATTVVSVAGDTVEDFVHVVRRLRGVAGIAAIEVNLSCPNVEHRGLVFALDPEASAELVRAVARVADVPVLAKLSADASDVVAVAAAAVKAGADGLTLINTILGMAIDPVSGRAELANTYGGLSGPAIRPVAVRVVHQVHTALPDVPIVGCGGVRSVEDVVQFLRAGASAVAVGTGGFVDPFATETLRDGLAAWLMTHGFSSVRDIIGSVRTGRDA
ncbi:MAG: dihydroorotate dehydrogenase [Actinomycetota bacterium]|nr:dihydroorotate dehydrogenase [Actinomycetota bacterium]